MSPLSTIRCLLTPIVAIHDGAVHSKMRKREQRKAKWRAEARASWYARLPPARSTKISSLVVGAFADVSTQRQSLFFAELPLELRRLVYMYALGGEQLQLEVVDENGNENPPGYQPYRTPQHAPPFRLRCLTAQRLLAFPQSCKMAYTEAAQLIYTSNTFRIPDITAYVCFQRLLPAHSFQAVQSIHLRWVYYETREMLDFLYGRIPYNISCWTQTWQEISQMKGLKYVRVDMVIWAPYVTADYEDLLFSPLEIVKGLEEIEVCVSWEEYDQANKQNGGKVWPFTVRRGMVNLA